MTDNKAMDHGLIRAGIDNIRLFSEELVAPNATITWTMPDNHRIDALHYAMAQLQEEANRQAGIDLESLHGLRYFLDLHTNERVYENGVRVNESEWQYRMSRAAARDYLRSATCWFLSDEPAPSWFNTQFLSAPSVQHMLEVNPWFGGMGAPSLRIEFLRHEKDRGEEPAMTRLRRLSRARAEAQRIRVKIHERRAGKKAGPPRA